MVKLAVAIPVSASPGFGEFMMLQVREIGCSNVKKIPGRCSTACSFLFFLPYLAEAYQLVEVSKGKKGTTNVFIGANKWQFFNT